MGYSGGNMKPETHSAVALARCTSYAEDKIRFSLERLFADLGLTAADFTGKRICLKPNLVMAKKPETGATTHPAVLAVLAKLLIEWGAADIVVADSPGGPFAAASVNVVYKVCGLEELDRIPGVRLNDTYTFRQVNLPDGRTLKTCVFLDAVLDCDMLINVCKLKTHGLTGLSCAVKNLFGIVPGVEKFAMHATYPKIEDFSDMLVDITEYAMAGREYLAVCDGIVGMEGNGPTHGTPVEANVLLASRSPYALDVLAAHIIGCSAPVVHLDKAAERGLTDRDWRHVTVLGDEVPGYRFKAPEASSGRFLKNLSGIMGGRLAEAFAAKPKINNKACVGCGVCERSCPAHAIRIENTGDGKRAVISYNGCIKCYCCQELCPHGAVQMRKNPLIRMIH